MVTRDKGGIIWESGIDCINRREEENKDLGHKFS